MIICPICHSENENLVVICKSCGSFLQTKVDNINLFETLWELIENPLKAFKKIALAKTKNYIILISGLFGISIFFLIFSFTKSADSIVNSLNLFIIGVVGGIPAGIVLLLILSVIGFTVVRIFKRRIPFRNVMAVFAYSIVPFLYDLVFLLPLKLLAFGVNYFKSSPSLSFINPTVYYIIISIEGFLFIWFIFLFIMGIKVLLSVQYMKSMLIGLFILSLGCGTIWFLSKWINNYLKNW